MFGYIMRTTASSWSIKLQYNFFLEIAVCHQQVEVSERFSLITYNAGGA